MTEITYYRKDDPAYPSRLHSYPGMPSGLYVSGRLPEEGRKTVAIVGARACSVYGAGQARSFARALSACGVQIISGLARGIDAAAHVGALEGGTATFAVMGCGADVCYPRENRSIYRKLLEQGGGIFSEFPPGAEPLSWHFPIRNRIISALSDLVLIVEARKKSGSLITADYALEQGKSVYAVPGRVGDALSEGCNALIAQGAGIACSAREILTELGLAEHPAAVRKPKWDPRSFSPEEQKVLALLGQDLRNLDELCLLSGLPQRTLTDLVFRLCMRGVLTEPAPGYYCRSET